MEVGKINNVTIEYYVASELWGLGYEAMKLPVDFGFDLIVSGQKNKALQEDNTTSMKFPFVIQVKSCRIGEKYIQTETSSRGCYPNVS